MSNPLIEQEADRIAEHVHITTHVVDGARQLYQQDRDKPRIRALVIAILNRIQELEDALWDVLVNTTLETATGATLDQIGEILLFGRGTVTDDEEYRTFLRGAILAHRSNGTGDDVLALARLLFGPDSTFEMREGYASILIDPHAVILSTVRMIARLFGMTKAAGVQLQLIDPPDAEEKLFTFSSDRFRMQSSAALGFADTAQTTGGALTGVVVASAH